MHAKEINVKLTDRKLMLRAIALARRCVSEPGKISPKVGAVAVRNGLIIGEARQVSVLTIDTKRMPETDPA
jgi:hypothetical protein